MERRISLVTLGVADVAASRAFYERLGWKASSIGGGQVAFFQAGGMAFAVWGRKELAEDAGLPLAGPGFGGVALAHNVRTRDEVEAVLNEAERAGAKILKPAHDAFWGGHTGYFADPDGHPWEVAWNPAFELTAEGNVILPA